MDTKQTTIMLVDDERLLLDLYVEALKGAGYAPVAYTSGHDAIAQLRAGNVPDVILFDINMPEMDGFTFLETVKRDKLALQSITVALTNESKEEDTKRVMDLGANGHFVKSQLSPTDLVTAVRGLLEKSHSV